MHVKMRDALADAIVGGYKCALRAHAQLDGSGQHSHIGEQRSEKGVRQVLDGFEVALGDKQAVAWKQRPMVEEGNCVLIFKNAKTVVMAHNFAEGAVFIEGGNLRAHLQSREASLS